MTENKDKGEDRERERERERDRARRRWEMVKIGTAVLWCCSCIQFDYNNEWLFKKKKIVKTRPVLKKQICVLASQNWQLN